MTDRIVETEEARDMLVKFVTSQKLPFTATITSGKHRTTRQNKLQRKWISEIAEQLAGTFDDAEHVRGYCKLHLGVPILREENEAFRLAYDKKIKPLPYEEKLEWMMEPVSIPVTSIMTTKQKTTYLDAVFRHFSEQGVVLTIPPEHDNEPSEAAPSTAEDAGSGEAPPSPPSAAEPSQAVDQGEGAPKTVASSPERIDKRVINLMVEARDKFMEIAVNPDLTPQERRGVVEKAKDAWKEALPENLPFVKACFEAADRVVKIGADRKDDEAAFLDKLIERARQ